MDNISTDEDEDVLDIDSHPVIDLTNDYDDKESDDEVDVVEIVVSDDSDSCKTMISRNVEPENDRIVDEKDDEITTVALDKVE